MDKIWIKDLEIFAYHGVLAEEKRNGQKFYVTVSMDVDLHAAGMTDDLDKTVNYAEVCELIRRTMQEESYDLIEAAAENVADAILLAYPQIKMVHVIVSKPGAPIPMDFDTVCVDITRGRHIAYLGIGSNLGDKEAYLDYAVDQLNKDEYIQVTKVSSYIITEPYGDVEQDDFLNDIFSDSHNDVDNHNGNADHDGSDDILALEENDNEEPHESGNSMDEENVTSQNDNNDNDSLMDLFNQINGGDNSGSSDSSGEEPDKRSDNAADDILTLTDDNEDGAAANTYAGEEEERPDTLNNGSATDNSGQQDVKPSGEEKAEAQRSARAKKAEAAREAKEAKLAAAKAAKEAKAEEKA